MILKMMLIVFGIFLLILDLFMYARQKLTDGIGLGWAIVSATFLVSGIAVSTDAATYLWNGAKSVVLFAFAVFVVIILFLFNYTQKAEDHRFMMILCFPFSATASLFCCI